MRTKKSRLQAETVINDGDIFLRRALPSAERTSLGPFVFLDHYRHRRRRGNGDSSNHQAGIEVISYLLQGSVEHRDSLGFGDRLGAKDAQDIRDGCRMLHAEGPLGGRHGLQLWTSLPPDQQRVEPAHSYRRADIPELRLCGARLRVISGVVDGFEGPMKLTTPTTLAIVHLEAGEDISLSVDKTQELGLYVLGGALTGVDSLSEMGGLVIVTSSDRLSMAATRGGAADVTLFGGAPTKGPGLFAGSFVMNAPERPVQARRDFASGKTGTFDRVPF